MKHISLILGFAILLCGMADAHAAVPGQLSFRCPGKLRIIWIYSDIDHKSVGNNSFEKYTAPFITLLVPEPKREQIPKHLIRIEETANSEYVLFYQNQTCTQFTSADMDNPSEYKTDRKGCIRESYKLFGDMTVAKRQCNPENFVTDPNGYGWERIAPGCEAKRVKGQSAKQQRDAPCE